MMTPMDPVTVPSPAKTRSPAILIMRPPDAAMLPMETTTGFSFPNSRSSS